MALNDGPLTGAPIGIPTDNVPVHAIDGGDHDGFPGDQTLFLRGDKTFAVPPGVPTSGDVVWCPGRPDLKENEFHDLVDAHAAALLRVPCSLFVSSRDGNLQPPAGTFDFFQIALRGVNRGGASITFQDTLATKFTGLGQLSNVALVNLDTTSSPLAYSGADIRQLDCYGVEFLASGGGLPVIEADGVSVGMYLEGSSQASQPAAFNGINGGGFDCFLGPGWFSSNVVANSPWVGDGTGFLNLRIGPTYERFVQPNAGYAGFSFNYGVGTNMGFQTAVGAAGWAGPFPTTLVAALDRLAVACTGLGQQP